MNCRGEKVLLDNFRKLYSEYSVDVQDVIRSAILDDVDIAEFVNSCRDNPYRLDQIRLALKENITGGILYIGNGETIREIRNMRAVGVDISEISRQLENASLSEKHISYLLKWVRAGYDTSDIDVSIVPKKLLEAFDYGLMQGRKMGKYSKCCSGDYILSCLRIEGYNKDVGFLLKSEYQIGVVEYLASFAKQSNRVWQELVRHIDSSISRERIQLLGSIALCGCSLSRLQEKDKKEYLFTNEALIVVLDACQRKVDVSNVIHDTYNERELKTRFAEIDLNKGKIVQVKLRKG